MWKTFQQLFEERATCREDHLVSFNTQIFAGQGDIGEVIDIIWSSSSPLLALEWVSPDLHIENQLEIISDQTCVAAEISSLIMNIKPPLQAIAGN